MAIWRKDLQLKGRIQTMMDWVKSIAIAQRRRTIQRERFSEKTAECRKPGLKIVINQGREAIEIARSQTISKMAEFGF